MTLGSQSRRGQSLAKQLRFADCQCMKSSTGWLGTSRNSKPVRQVNGRAKFHLSLPLGHPQPGAGGGKAACRSHNQGCLGSLGNRRWGRGAQGFLGHQEGPISLWSLPRRTHQAVTHREKFLLISLEKEITSHEFPTPQPGALFHGGLAQLPAFSAALCFGDRTKGPTAAL